MRRESLNAAKAIIVRLCCIALLSMLIVAEWPGAGGDARAAATVQSEKIAFLSTRDGNSEIYIMNADGSEVERLTNHPAIDDAPCISPDGSKIAFVSNRDGSDFEIYVMDVKSKTITQLTNNTSQDREPVFSLDGSQIAFRSDRDGDEDIYIMKVDGTEQRNITNNVEAEDAQPAFSPNGSQIVFRSIRNDSSGIYIIDVDGTDEKLLINDPSDQLDPTFSPDGSKIAFSSFRDGNFEIYIMNVDGGEPRNLTQTSLDDVQPAFSLDGSKIAFSSSRNGRDFEIYVMDVNMDAGVSEPKNITNNSGFDFHPSWSDGDSDGDGVLNSRDNCPLMPNPEKIAFSATRDNNYDIYLVDPDGSNEKRLTLTGAVDSEPAFSPDGSKIVFASTRTGRGDIYVMDVDGNNLKQLTTSGGLDFEPSFSPDGSKIVFGSTRTGNSEIFIMNADGSNQVNLTNHDEVDGHPVFTPDGNRIVFASDREGGAEIWIMDADGSNPTRLTFGDGPNVEPDVSPNGRRIVFTSRRDDNGEIYIMDIDGKNQTNLTNHNAEEQDAVFSPDGSKIAFMSLREGPFNIFVMNVDGSNPQRITNGFPIDLEPSWGRQADSDKDGIGDACDNNPPSIAPQGVTIERGSSSSFTIATASDAEQTSESLGVTVNDADGATVKGVSVSGISISTSGEVEANVSASCSADTASFTLRVTDDGDLIAETMLTVSVTSNPAPVLGYDNPPPILVGSTTTISPSTGPSDNGGIVSITLQSLLPTSGLALSVDSVSGTISVTQAISPGTYNAIIRATDQCGATTDAALVIEVVCPTVTLSDLPNGEAGINYSHAVVPSSEGSYVFSLLLGNLPPGLSLNPTTGILSGLTRVAGTYQFTIKASPANGCAATRSYVMVISCPTITLSDLPAFALNAPYNHKVTAAPVTGTYRLELIAGSLPAGLVFNPTTGVIGGKPTKTGPYSFTIRATGFGTCAASRTYSGEITASCPAITLAAIPNGAVGKMFSAQVTAAPAASYSYTLVSGSLPPGVSFYGSFGLLYGYPSVAGDYQFRIRATDINGCSTEQDYTLTINGK